MPAALSRPFSRPLFRPLFPQPFRHARRHLRGRLEHAGDQGQAVLALVIGIALILVTSGAILMDNVIQHDPLVQVDALAHYAYRALEAGTNSYLNTINAQPDLVNCSSASTTTTCAAIAYDQWTQVPGTTESSGNVPEYYLWTNPQLCFSQTKTAFTKCTPTPATGNFELLQVKIIGAAGFPGHYQYQSSVASFSAGQGFLTRVWWSNYEAQDPSLTHVTPNNCHYDWSSTTYSGMDGTCGPVYFGPGDVVDGPVFTNDSVYATTDPVFGTPTNSQASSSVSTADPHCLFVDPLDGHGTPSTCAAAATQDVGRYTAATSQHGLPVEPVPTSDAQLQQVAALNGCVYSGPTTISLYATASSTSAYMNVNSPETPLTTSTGHDEDNLSTNTHRCVGTHIPAPTSAHTGNGVIFVANATSSCSGNGVNPLDGIRQGKATPRQPATIEAQIVYPGQFKGTSSGYDFVFGETPMADDCAGDVFVKDASRAHTPSGDTPGIAGNLTIAAQNNVIITGNLEYTDCGSTFAAKGHTRTCAFNPGGVNDSLGLIATNFVEVNRPEKPSCSTTKSGGIKCSGSGTLLTHCAATVTALTAVLCDPGPTVVVDAAVLALKHSFTVNNYTITPQTGRLYVYGSIAQDWRGAVGQFGYGGLLSGYSKYYVWDSRLQYVTIPHYLTPSTPSWLLVSSSVVMSTSCPAWPKPYPTGSTSTASTANYPGATTNGPTGAAGAC